MGQLDRSTAAGDVVVASYVALSSVVWFNNGIGPILPSLEDDVGGWAGSVYPLVPGGAMLLWSSIVIVAKPRLATTPRPDGVAQLIRGSLSMAVAVVVMGLTRWPVLSVIGVALAAFAAAYVARALTSVLKTVSGANIERVLMRGNAYASVASIAAPMTIAASIALGAGWLPGMAVPIGIGAAAVAVAARNQVATSPSVVAAASTAAVAFRRWWREYAALTLGIVIEFCFVFFAATYLHDELQMSKAAAAGGTAAWGVGMAVGRFAISTRTRAQTVAPSVVVVGVGFAMLWTTGNGLVAITGIGIAGLGAAPLYPSRLAALLNRFTDAPDDGAARGLLASGTAVLAAPALIAVLRAVSDVRTAFLAVPALLIALLALTRGSDRRQSHPVVP